MIRFGDCALDTDTHILYRDGESYELQSKVFEVLLYLLQHRDHIISQQELSQLWSDSQGFSNAVLESTMRRVRQSIGDSGRIQRYIRTFYGSGYRFVENVEEEVIEEAVPPFRSSKAEKDPRLKKKAKILVVDDDPSILDIVDSFVSPEGYEVITIDNGNDAINIASEENPDIIILDIGMPYVDGFRIFDELQNRNINSRIIVCSGLNPGVNYLKIDPFVESVKRWADDFLGKPFTKEEILTMIKSILLRGRRSPRL